MADRADRAPRGEKRHVLAAVALWTTVMGGVAVFAGCYGHICDGDFVVYGRNVNEGHLIDSDTWESTPTDSPWLPFPKQRIYAFEVKDLGDRLPYEITPYVSAQGDPIHEGGNFTIAAGNLTEIFAVEKGKFAIKNDTCADYWVRVVAKAPPRPGAAPAVSPADAGVTDAGGDAEAGP